ncbi:UDP-N-acetylglucosamine 2-epimerase (non-hydrolyzing) [Treponema sp. OMZ 787]|uniref:non-hydrolyzing UDP-N-acetylglucosamine 2-epimerase n=1 Tax=Treponema sp. OMZ 787 TaxID=2563669 RepID=UPI0020A35285|nr:UDP-N-acetylglucosamine 2-epimerase (non-hydrolyzing) [Treponema sp. OMZ 787]UTC61608.1 UDP-N-acetylglucosamine 2-epimerase (non-hydrolyzing) [Treponema sp. OMZ 787]
MHILTIIGARPQFIKAAVLSRYIKDNPHLGIKETLVHTGQHYDQNMSDIFFTEMDIPHPDYNLQIGSGSHGKMTGLMLEKIEELLLNLKPDLVLVYGDTNSTLAGALAASKLHIPVAHVEAGLRSFMMAMPEEQNRRLTDHLSTWLFCPTDTAVENLKNEGIVSSTGKPSADNKFVCKTGDIMYDASLYYRKKAVKMDVPDDFILLTIHRAENTDDPARLKNIVSAINAVSEKNFIFPVHPRTKKILTEQGLQFSSHVRLIEPIGYLEMLKYEESCSAVLTDSGGVQKEAFFFKKPCITMRDSTEWVELVDSGWNTLTGADTEKIIFALKNIKVPKEYPELYGNGETAENIAAVLRN